MNRTIRFLVGIPACLLAHVAVPAAQRPNVVLLISDDQRWDDYAFMGHPVIKTPNLDRLAAQSLVFRRGYVPTSLCRPSLATIITGLYPHQHHITGNDPAQDKGTNEGRAGMVRRFLETQRLPEVLKRHGYVSFQAGKWWEGHYQNGGFTHGMSHGDVTRGGRHGDLGLRIGRETMQPVWDFIDMAVNQDRPFFLWYAPMMPHLPHRPPEDLLAIYRSDDLPDPVARYYAMCTWWDQTCGEVLDYLDRKRIADDTLVIYLSDNGWTQQADSDGGAYGGPRGKRSAYDGGVRTPILIRWPGRVTAGRDAHHLASSVDVVPTVLAAVGVDRPSLPGINLLDAEAVAARDAVFGEIYTHDVPDVNQPAKGLLHRWIVKGPWKLIEPTARATGQFGPTATALFHVADDPEESRNLAEVHPEIVDELRARLKRWWQPQYMGTACDPAGFFFARSWAGSKGCENCLEVFHAVVARENCEQCGGGGLTLLNWSSLVYSPRPERPAILDGTLRNGSWHTRTPSPRFR